MLRKVKRVLALLCAVLLVAGSCMTVSAATSYFDLVCVSECSFDLSEFENAGFPTDYVLCFQYVSGEYGLFLSSSPFYFYYFYSDKFMPDSDDDFYYGYGFDGADVLASMNIAGPREVKYKNTFSYYSSHDVFYGTQLVFQAPEPPQAQPPQSQSNLAEMVQGIVPDIQNQTKVIVTVAVSCLASLVGLTVLARKLKIFLPS